MSEPNALSAAITMVLVALGISIVPEKYVMASALGCGIGYFFRAIAPRQSRSEIWVVPISGVVCSTLALMVHPWLCPDVPPVLVGTLAGASGVPIMRFSQIFIYRMPSHAEKISDGVSQKLSGKSAEKRDE